MICLSLKWRVSLWVSAVLVAVIVTISIVAYFEFEESHLGQTDQTLLAMANGILASLDDYHDYDKLEQEVLAVTESSGPDAAFFSYRIWMEGSSADLQNLQRTVESLQTDLLHMSTAFQKPREDNMSVLADSIRELASRV